MHCVLCLMSRLSIQEIKAHHASMVQMLSYVETVDTLRSKQMSNALCVVSHVETVDTRDQSTRYFNGSNAILCRDSRYTKIKAYWAMHCVLCLMSRLSIQEIKALDTSMVQMLCYVETVDTRDQSTRYFNGSNAMLCRYSRYKMHIHVHMFLPITFLIFNGFSIRKKFWNAENQGFSTIPPNPIYVDTVDRSRNISMQ